MSGFRRLAFTARTSRLCACTKVIALCRALAELPTLTIVDLACGTGSTLRACTTSALQNWKLVDNDLTRW